MKKHILSLAVAGSILGLTACGGGDDDGGGSTPPPESYVSGTFYDARITGENYPTDTDSLGGYGGECIGQHHYFEDDKQRIRVYGTAGISEDTFRLMATHIDNNLDSVMSLFNTSWSSFVSGRNILALGSMENLLKYQIENDGSVKPALVNDGDTWTISDPEQSYAAWMAMTEEERIQTVADVATMLDDSSDVFMAVSEEDYPRLLDRDYLVACLNPSMGGNTSGEGLVTGIALTPTPSSYNGDFDQLVKHELVHFFQENLTRVGGIGRSLPRWFSEGQAVVFAGQRYHAPSVHYNYEPLDVVGFSDEVGDPGEAYKHYGLAYNYLDRANGKPVMAEFLSAIKSETVNPFNQNMSIGEYSQRFTNAFDAFLVDHNGDPLTFSDYRTNYHDIMNTQY